MSRMTDDIASRVHPISISSANCVAVTGMSWSWVTRFARAHGVPIWRIGTRKQLIPAASLLAAMERVAAEATPARELTVEEEVEKIKAEITAAVHGNGAPKVSRQSRLRSPAVTRELTFQEELAALEARVTAAMHEEARAQADGRPRPRRATRQRPTR